MSLFGTQNQPGQNQPLVDRPTSKLHARSRPARVITSRSLGYTLLLGVISGSVFSISLWGYELVVFSGSHIAYPWIPFATGTILSILLCTGAALLTLILNRALLGLIIWVISARLLAELAIHLPTRITPRLMILLEPVLKSHLPVYPINATFSTWATFDTIWLGIFFGILGLIQLTLVDQGVPATSTAGRLVPYFVFIPVMLVSSVMSGNMINEQIRGPALAVNDAIQSALAHQNSPATASVASQEHLGTMNAISTDFSPDYRLFLGKYDDAFSQVNVLIDFAGKWAECTTVNNQPVFCQTMPNP